VVGWWFWGGPFCFFFFWFWFLFGILFLWFSPFFFLSPLPSFPPASTSRVLALPYRRAARGPAGKSGMQPNTRSRPVPVNQPERALSHAATAVPLCRCGRGTDQEVFPGHDPQFQRSQAYCGPFAWRPTPALSSHVSRRSSRTATATGRRALKRAMQLPAQIQKALCLWGRWQVSCQTNIRPPSAIITVHTLNPNADNHWTPGIVRC